MMSIECMKRREYQKLNDEKKKLKNDLARITEMSNKVKGRLNQIDLDMSEIYEY